METAVPMLQCVALDELLDFYKLLGFEATYRENRPYAYGVVQRGGCELHFYGLKGLDAAEGPS